MTNSTLFKSDFTIPTTNAAVPTTLCPGDLPLVLLPVRLETRFFPQPNGDSELRIRVYPDKIHLDSHERDLTADEHTWGRHYYEQDWHAGNDRAARMAAWQQLADRFGAERAAWIARLLQPINSNQRPTQSIPPDQPLTPPPVFPTVTVVASDSTWRRAPQARLLPDRWIAVIHSAGQVALTATSGVVRRPLNAGPDPQAPLPQGAVKAAIERGERLAVDDGMKWMVDFEAAETAGMALRMLVPAAMLNAGLDSLLVFGVIRSLSVAETAAQLADLLDAHHYTDGLGFLRSGTPTNNTDDRRTSYNASDPGHARSFATEISPAATTGPNNAAAVGTALGISAPRIDATLGRVERGLAHDDADMKHMNVALWPVGWGYYLSNMIGSEAGLTPELIDWARSHFIRHVRCFGPFPTLRCGGQPYGILPVTSLDQWQPDADAGDAAAPQTWLKDLLLNLRDQVWRPALGSAARIGSRQNPRDPDADLADVMRTDALSNSYAARNVFGRHFLQHLYRRILGTWPGNHPAQTALLEQLGITWRPRLTHTWNAAWTWQVSAPLVQAGEVTPWAALEPNYIEALAGMKIEDVIAWRPAPDATDNTTSLLQTLLRHAFLREIAEAAALLRTGNSAALAAELLRDTELIDLVSGAAPTEHWRRLLQWELSPPPIRITVQQQLDLGRVGPPWPASSLGQFRASLAWLKTLDSEALQILMQGTLDLSVHRLDAWITSVATQRLAGMHNDGPAGQYIGAYAWVENLQPMPASLSAPVTPPPGEPEPMRTSANDSGFVHAPSATHAAAAALLRNAQLGANNNVPRASGPFAIELTSKRAREAARLLDGVRSGQPLGALLGYRVERMLHEARVDNGRSMDRFIAAVRRVAPLVAREHPDAAGPTESIAANNVVDGFLLHRRWSEERQAVLDELNREGLYTFEEAGTIDLIFAALGDMIDGLSDALTAEAAYQMARGNTSRLVATLPAIAQGDAPPPELEVARTPRSGISITHRVLALLSATQGLSTPGWLAGDVGLRSRFERAVNSWVARLLGDPTKIRCTLESVDEAGNVAQTCVFYLSELALTPLDVVYTVEPLNNSAADAASLSELEQRVIYHSKRRADGFAAQAVVRIRHARPADLADGELTLFDLLEQARAARRLLSAVRAAMPEDLNPPERLSQGTIDFADFENRVVHAENGFNAACNALVVMLDRPATLTTESLRSAMTTLGSYGVGPWIPVSIVGEDPEAIAALTQQAQALVKTAKARWDRVMALRTQLAAAQYRARYDQLAARMKAVYGDAFVTLPRFTLGAPEATELASAMTASSAVQGGDPLAVNTWFAKCSRVRDALARMRFCLQRAEVLQTGTRLDLTVAQLPHTAGDRWVALPVTPGSELPPSKLSLALHTLTNLRTTDPLVGMLIDEWVEIVPSTHETTALAFQFDVPDSNAPQNILIAVPPVPGQDWTTETLRRVLMETLDLAKLRAVDTGSLGAAAQHLPGLYLAFNTQDHAVSTDFKPLTE